MILPGLIRGHQAFVKIWPILYIHCISVKYIVDNLSVFGPEEGIIVDELPGVEQVPKNKIDIGPGLGDPLAARLGALVEDTHPVAEELRPFLISGEEIHEPPLGDRAVGRPLPQVLDRRAEGRLDSRRRCLELMGRLEQPDRPYGPGTELERRQESVHGRTEVGAAARANDQDIFRTVPDGFRRMDVKAALPRKIGIGVSQPLHVQLKDPGIIRDVPCEDQVLTPEVCRPDGVHRLAGDR